MTGTGQPSATSMPSYPPKKIILMVGQEGALPIAMMLYSTECMASLYDVK